MALLSVNCTSTCVPFVLPYCRVADLDEWYGPMEVDDDFGTARGTGTLADRDIVPPGFDNTAADTLRYVANRPASRLLLTSS